MGFWLQLRRLCCHSASTLRLPPSAATAHSGSPAAGMQGLWGARLCSSEGIVPVSAGRHSIQVQSTSTATPAATTVRLHLPLSLEVVKQRLSEQTAKPAPATLPVEHQQKLGLQHTEQQPMPTGAGRAVGLQVSPPAEVGGEVPAQANNTPSAAPDATSVDGGKEKGAAKARKTRKPKLPPVPSINAPPAPEMPLRPAAAALAAAPPPPPANTATTSAAASAKPGRSRATPKPRAQVEMSCTVRYILFSGADGYQALKVRWGPGVAAQTWTCRLH
jgi:hypothetical protein